MNNPPQIHDQLCFTLYQASMAINRAYKPALDKLDLTYTQYIVMCALIEKGALTVGQIAQYLNLESSTVTPLVKRLEKSGFVTRKRNPEDERQVLVELTTEGRDVRARANCLGTILLEASAMPIPRLIGLNEEVKAFRDAVFKFSSPGAKRKQS